MGRLSWASIIAIAMASTTLGCGEVEVPAGTSDAAMNDAATNGPDAEVDDCPLGALCGTDQNIAFVTSGPVFPGDLMGVSGGDDKCNAVAQIAGLPGTYIAWLSDSNSDAVTRLEGASGWVRPDGRPFALNRARLLAGQLLYPLSLDEFGMERTVNVFTGTSMEGTVTSQTCENWTSGAAQGESGRSHFVSRAWSSFGAFPCGQPAHLYCLGVDFDNPLTLPVVTGRTVWLSSEPIDGTTGLEDMKARCNKDGAVLGVTNAEPYVGISQRSIADRLNLDGTRWVRPDGVLLWENAAELATQSPLAPMGVTANGAFKDVLVWGGVSSTAELASISENCNDWTSENGQPIVGRSISIGPAHLDAFGGSCGSADVHIYCFEN